MVKILDHFSKMPSTNDIKEALDTIAMTGNLPKKSYNEINRVNQQMNNMMQTNTKFFKIAKKEINNLYSTTNKQLLKIGVQKYDLKDMTTTLMD